MKHLLPVISIALASGILLSTTSNAPAAVAQQAYLKASNAQYFGCYGGPGGYCYGNEFGNAMAMSGDTLVVGAHYESSSARGVNGNQTSTNSFGSGAVYVFLRTGTTWTQQAYLKASNTRVGEAAGNGNRFGSAVAISGNTVVVGAPLETSNATGVNSNQNNSSVLFAGAVYVFVRSGTNWSQQAYLKASNTEANDRFGGAVAISGDTVVVGAGNSEAGGGEDSNATGVNGDQSDNSADSAGAAYIFVRSGTNWSQQAYLKASNTDGGDLFGSSVAISGDTVVVGAFGEDSSATGVDSDQSDNSADGAGAAYVFVRSGTNWDQQAYLKASNTDADDAFGNSVAISGDTVVIGAGRPGTVGGEDSNATGVNGDQSDNSATNSGAAYVFVRNGTTWSQQAYLKASNTGGQGPGEYWGDSFGVSVAISGDRLVVGALYEESNATGVNGDQSDNSANNAGAAYVFVRNGTTWTQEDYLKASNTEAGDKFGSSVAISGDTVVVGATGEASASPGVNGNQSDNSANSTGAAYVFTGVGLPPQLTIVRSAPNLTLSWPVSATNYLLEAAPSLPAISWAAVTNTPTVTATNRSVQLPLTGPAQFFRLRKP